MMLRSLVMATAVAAVPFAASATTTTTVGNQTSIFYDNNDSDVDLGLFDLSIEPVGVTGLFTADDVSGSLTFSVFSSAGLPKRGSIDINPVLDLDNETFSGTFNGVPLNFMGPVGGDFVATFNSSADPAEFVLDFSGFDRGDLFQVNVAEIPLPASILMLLGALAGVAFLGRTRRS